MTEIKKVFFYAIIPALISGAIAIGPQLYKEITEPQAVLEYSITKGPILQTDNVYKSIFSIHVVNNGKNPLSDITSVIKSKGKIDAISTYQDTGLSPFINNSDNSIRIETLHPSESFTISLMLSTLDENNDLSFILRSKETLGREFNFINSEETNKLTWYAALAISFTVFIILISFMNKIKKGTPFAGLNIYKADTLFYIAAKFGFNEIINQYGINDPHVTYLRFGDLLYAAATSDPTKSAKSIIALKSMLLIEHMSESSKNIIISNIKKLEGDTFQEQEINALRDRCSDASTLLDLRGLIDKYNDNPIGFITAENQTNS